MRVSGISSGARGFIKDAWQNGDAWAAKRARVASIGGWHGPAPRNRAHGVANSMMAHPRGMMVGGGVVGTSSGAMMWNHHRAQSMLNQNNDSYY